MRGLAQAAVVALAVTGIGAFSLTGCSGGQAASTSGVNLDRVTGIQRELGGARDLAKVDEGADLTCIDYTEPARDYMRSGGMTDEQIDAFVARLKQ